MNIIGYTSLVLAFFLSLAFEAHTLIRIIKRNNHSSKYYLYYHNSIFIFVLISCVILGYAFLKKDFSLVYVYSYCDKSLKWYYALTAFWAGQEGSLLLWVFLIILCGSIWTATGYYKKFIPSKKDLFWLFLLPVEIFFLMLLVSNMNPFIKQTPVPINGAGLNPLLQHPAMAFHPPLLFLGYSGFFVSACVVIVGFVKKELKNQLNSCRGWMIIFWSFLTAGILLGCWWSYMELGWGGYWAWDPVENSSLIPWLMCSSFLHISHITRKKNLFQKTSFLLAAFIPVSCILGTFLTRSGFLESLHTFSESKVGIPILIFMIFYSFLLLIVLFENPQKTSTQPNLPFIFSKEGLIILTNWLFLFLLMVTLLGTVWPVLSGIFQSTKTTVGPNFFNNTCLPIFTLILLVLVLCCLFIKNTNIRWSGLFLFFMVLFWFLGIKKLLVLISVSSGISIFILLTRIAFKYKSWTKKNWEILGIHIAIAIIAIGIALSSGFKFTKEISLKPGEKTTIQNLLITYKDYNTELKENSFLFQCKLEITKDNKILGTLTPYKKISKNSQSFSKVEVLSGIIKEIYVVILSFDTHGNINIQISIHPFINWFWAGGFLLCIFSLIYGLKIFYKKHNIL